MSTIHPTRPSQARPVSPNPRAGGIADSAQALDPFKVIRKHLNILIASMVFGGLFGVVLWIGLRFIYPLYTSSVIFEIKPALAEAGQVVSSDIVQDDVVVRYARTEATYVVSRNVLGQALSNPAVQTTEWAKWFTDSSGNFEIEDAIDELIEDLAVQYIPDTNLFQVQWSTHAKEDVPVVLNAIRDAYIDRRSREQNRLYDEDLNLFTQQAQTIQTTLRNLQQSISAFVRENGIFTLEQVRDHPLTAQVASLNASIAATQAQIAYLQSQYQLTSAKLTGEVEPSPDDRLIAEQDRTVLALIQRVVDSSMFRQNALDKFGMEHQSFKDADRAMRNAEAERDRRIEETIQRNLNGQLKQFANQIENYRNMVEQYRADLVERDKEFTQLAGRVSEYESLVQQRDQLQEQYNATQELITELNRVRLRTAASRVQLFNSATTPRELSFPLPEIMIPLGFLLVVGIVTGLVFVRELTDRRVKSASDLAIVPGAKVLGVIPDIEEDPTRIDRAELAVREEPRSVIAESYRQTCTPILKGLDRSGHQTLLVVGGLPGSGSTTVVTNLAAFVAAGGRRVLAIDANFRRPGVARAFELKAPDGAGLGDVLCGQSAAAEVIESGGTNIDVMSAGTPASRVYERLSNGQFEVMLADLRSKYDYIIIDAPPAVVAGDALLLAGKVDASALVVRAYQEHRGLVSRLITQLNDAQSELLGVVLNRPRWTAGGYFKKNFATMAEYASKAGG